MQLNPPSGQNAISADQSSQLLQRLLDNLEKVIRGKRDTLQLLLCCLAAEGHALLEDIPGTGKTTLAKSLAFSMQCDFKRVQFTPDLLPTDILGASIFNPQQGTFHFNPGPIFANVLVADEINRASPRTQSALLEAMGEQQVTIDGQTRPLDSPFLCIATQNPVEFHGTYPLPEAQLDRFSVRLALGYVGEDEELRILETQQRGQPLHDIQPVASADEIIALQQAVRNVLMEESVARYLIRLVAATRDADRSSAWRIDTWFSAAGTNGKGFRPDPRTRLRAARGFEAASRTGLGPPSGAGYPVPLFGCRQVDGDPGLDRQGTHSALT